VVEYLPALQSVHVSLVAPTVIEYLPALQSVHASGPVTVLYLPAAQEMQFVPVNPALHAHTVLPAAEAEFVGHA